MKEKTVFEGIGEEIRSSEEIYNKGKTLLPTGEYEDAPLLYGEPELVYGEPEQQYGKKVHELKSKKTGRNVSSIYEEIGQGEKYYAGFNEQINVNPYTGYATAG